MAKNLIPEAVKMLGLEIGEEFNFCGYRKNNMIDENGKVLEATDSGEWKRSDFTTLADLLRVSHEIRKLPWKPKDEDVFYSFVKVTANKIVVCENEWLGAISDIARFKAGWVYRTEEEAKAALPKVAEELGVDYEL